MLNSPITSKGQVTIPAALREKLGLKPGDKVTFAEEAGKVILQRVETRVESVFGLIKATKSASLENMEATIGAARGRRARH